MLGTVGLVQHHVTRGSVWQLNRRNCRGPPIAYRSSAAMWPICSCR